MSKRIRLFEEDEDFLAAQHCKGNLRKTTPQLVARIVYIPLLCGRKFHGTLMKFDMLRRERRMLKDNGGYLNLIPTWLPSNSSAYQAKSVPGWWPSTTTACPNLESILLQRLIQSKHIDADFTDLTVPEAFISVGSTSKVNSNIIWIKDLVWKQR